MTEVQNHSTDLLTNDNLKDIHIILDDIFKVEDWSFSRFAFQRGVCKY